MRGGRHTDEAGTLPALCPPPIQPRKLVFVCSFLDPLMNFVYSHLDFVGSFLDLGDF